MSERIVARRLRAQCLSGALCAAPEEAVGRLLGVQAQEYGSARWAVGARVAGATDAAVEAAVARGRILRTHVLRPTWHFVLPADIRWLLTATAPRVRALDARRYAQLGLDEETLLRSWQAFAAALRGGSALTRGEMAEALAEAGVAAEGQRLPYLLMSAELGALICSGPRRGTQHTYALLEERAPQASSVSRDAALAELARRYFAGHGPATARDFAGWATLTLAEARAAIEAAASDLAAEELGGLRLWSAARGPGSPGDRLTAPAGPVVHLVQGYDELIMGYSETKSLLAREGSSWAAATPPVGRLLVLVDGRVGGFWRRRLTKARVQVEVELIDAWDDASREALAAEARRYAVFLGLDLELRVVARA